MSERIESKRGGALEQWLFDASLSSSSSPPMQVLATLSPSQLEAGEHAAALLVYLGATGVWFGKREGSDQLTYHLQAKFPASHVIGWVSQRLHEAGWEPLTYDFLNPNLPSSHVKGWGQKFIDSRKTPEVCVHAWSGDWKDPSGNLVNYAFVYRQPCDSSDLTDLEVDAGYYPAAVVEGISVLIQK